VGNLERTTGSNFGELAGVELLVVMVGRTLQRAG
jgi:hypothetical protein